jgi:hypothetical protein
MTTRTLFLTIVMIVEWQGEKKVRTETSVRVEANEAAHCLNQAFADG